LRPFDYTTAEDVQFFTCKDMSHGIIGIAADGTMAGPYVDPRVQSSI